jgi:uncharacterized damage-inducible protein DinB
VTVTDLKRLFDYGYWANAQVFEVIARLTPEEFAQPVAGSYGSIRNTLVHTMSAEAGWLDRCGGPKRGPKLDPADYPTLPDVQQHWNQIEQQVRTFLATLHDEDLDRRIEYSFHPGPTSSGTVGELMQHAVIMRFIIAVRSRCCSGCSATRRGTSTCCFTTLGKRLKTRRSGR